MSKFALTAELNLQIPKTKVNTSLRGLKKSLKDIGSVDVKLNTKGTAKSVRDLKKKLNEIGNVQVKFTGLKNARKFAQDVKKHLKSVDVEVNLKLPKNVQRIQNQLASQMKPVDIPISVKNAAKTSKELSKVSTTAKAISNDAKSAASGMDQFSKSMRYAFTHIAKFDLARRIFYGFVNVLEQGIKDAIEFERSMIKVAQVAGTTLQNVSGLQKTVSDLSTSLGVSSNSLVKTALILKQTGLGLKDVQIAMQALAKTELAPTFDNITNTTEAAVAAMRQFKIEASGLEPLLGKINAVAGQFAVESSDIGQAIIRTGGAFKAAGGNVEELIALFTSVRATTRETAETIATGFRTIFTRLQRPKTIEFLRSFGIELTNLEGQFVGPYEAIRRLSGALQGLESTDLRFSAIVEQLGGFRQVSKVIPLIQEFSTAQAALMAQQSGANSLSEDAKKAQQSLAVQLAKVKEEFKELGREILASDGFQVLTTTAISFAKALTEVFNALSPLIPLISVLGTIKLGGLAFGASKGLFGGKNAGGRIHRFSAGGWVPGRGNGDTVPALLEPGEFVLRKSAAQALGSSLNGINGYASGGDITAQPSSISKFYTKMGQMYSQAGPISHKKKKSEAWKDSINFTPKDRIGINNQVVSVGLKGLRKTKTNAQNAYTFLNGSKTQKGSAWENLLRASGQLKDGPIFAGTGPDLDGKYGTYMADAALSANSHSNRHMIAKAMNTPAGVNALNDIALSTKSDNVSLGIETKELIPDGTVKATLTRKFAKKATGGGIFGSGLSPVMLTPGEFVVNKDSARSIGYGKLGAMNKYATGGRVGRGGVKHFNTGGMMGAVGGMGAFNIAGISAMSQGAATLGKNLLDTASAATFMFTAFKAGGEAVKSFAGQLGIAGEGFDGLVDSISGGMAAYAAVSKAQQGLADMFGDTTGKMSKRAEGGLFGAGIGLPGGKTRLDPVQDLRDAKAAAEKGQAERAAKAQTIKKQGIQGAADQAAGAEMFEKAKAQQEALVARLQQELGKDAKSGKLVGKKRIEEALKGNIKPGDDPMLDEILDRKGKFGDVRKENFEAQMKRDEGSRLKRQGTANIKASTQNSIKAAKAGEAAAKAEQELINKRQRQVKALKMLGMAVQVAIAAVGKFGDKMKAEAMEQIKSGEISGGRGEAAVAKAGVGGALSGGAAGAQAGAVFGPWGMAIGAAVGGIYGFVNATKEAEDALRQRKFTDATNEMADAMEAFTNKELSDKNALRKTMAAKEAAKGTVAGEEGLKFGKQNRQQTKILVESMAKSSNSVDEFDARINDVLPTLLKENSIRQSQIDKIREEIEARQNAKEKLDEAARAREEEIAKLRQVKGTVKAFDEAAYRAKRFGDALAKTASPTGAINIGAGISSQLNPSDSTDKESIQRMEGMIDRLTNVAGERVFGQGGGLGMGRFSQDAKNAAFIQRNISTMVLGAASGTNITEDSFSENLKAQLDASIKREGFRGLQKGFGGDSARNRLDKVIAGLSPDLIKQLNDPSKRQGAMDAIEDQLKGSQQEMLDAFIKVAKLVEGHVNNLGAMYAKRNALELDYINKSNQAMQMRFDAEQEYAKNISISRFGGPTDEQVQANFKGQQANLLGSAGLDPAMAGNVGQLANEFREVRKKLDKNTENLQKQDHASTGIKLGEGMSKMVDENAKLQKQYSALKQALEKNTNSTQRLSALQESLKREQEKQKTLEQLTFDAAYGTAEEKETASRLINAVNTAIQAGSVTAVAPELQRQVANLLPQVAGKEGESIRRRGLNKFLGTSGFAPTAAGNVDFQGVTAVSEKQVQIAAQILEIQKSAADAQEALADDVKTSADNMSSAIVEANDKFLGELRKLLLANFRRDIDQDAQVQKARKDSLGTTRADFNRIGFNIGNNPETVSRMVFIESVVKNLENQANLEKTREQREGLLDVAARGPATNRGFSADNLLAIMDEFGDNNVGNALQAALDDSDASINDAAPGSRIGMLIPSMVENFREKRNAAAALSLLIGSGEQKTRADRHDPMRKLETRDFTQSDVDLLNAVENDNDKAMEQLAKRVRDRIFIPMSKIADELPDFEESAEFGEFSNAIDNLDRAGTGELFGQELVKVIEAYEKAKFQIEQSGRTLEGYASAEQLAMGEGTKRTKAKELYITNELRNELIKGTKDGQELLFGKQKVKREDISTSGKLDEEKILLKIAERLRQMRADLGSPADFIRKEAEAKRADESIESRRREADAQATATGFDNSTTGAAMATLAQKGLEEGSIFTHDTHCEAVLERIAVALEGGAGTASNPASQTTGSVAFTQTLDSSGFQDGVDKFSTTVESLREIMAGALNVEIGGTVTVDVNLKEGAAFLNDSKNAIGMMVSQKINGAINNFIKNGLKDARVNTGNWDDSEATPLANNGGY